jgi:hypothetical protein
MMSSRGRALALTIHVTVAVGWAGALAVFLAHAGVAVLTDNVDIARAADIAMGIAAWFVILPLAVATLASGIVQGIGTPWGLVRHYWVLAKLILTAFATAVLLLKLAPIRILAEMPSSLTDPGALRVSLLVHAIGGLVVLIGAAALAIYKPVGMTVYGARQSATAPTASAGWRHALRLGLAALVIVLLAMALFGQHGPGAH